MVILTFIRHGETDFNKYGILQGHLNIPLNQNGRQESAILGHRLSGQIEEFPVNLIISSDLDRASETALIIHQCLSMVTPHPIPVLQTPLLRERYLGKLEGVDLKQLVNWKELTEQPKQMIDIQKILSIRNLSLNSVISNPNSYLIDKYSNSNNSSPSSSSPSSPAPIKHKIVPTNNTLFSTFQTNITTQQTFGSDILSTSPNTTLSSNSSASTSEDISEGSSSELTNDDFPSSTSSSLSSSTSSLSSIDDTLINSHSQTSIPPSTPNIKLTSNILKHLPQKELKLESKSKLIKRAKEAFQYILKQIPSNLINTTNNNASGNNINENETTDPKNDFHIVIVSHNVMLRALVSLLFCKKSSPSNLFCKLSSSNIANTNSNINTPTNQQTQSESSSRNFKWVQLEFKNNHLFRTSFTTFEKKSLKNTFKRIPRNIELLHFTDSQQPHPIKNIIIGNNANNIHSSVNNHDINVIPKSSPLLSAISDSNNNHI